MNLALHNAIVKTVLLLKAGDWDEEKHPCAEDGKFTQAEGSIAESRLSNMQEAESGYRTFDQGEQVTLKDLTPGFASGLELKLFGGLPKATSNKWRVMDIPLSDLGRAQSSVTREGVRTHLRGKDTIFSSSKELPDVVLSEGKFYIQTGHHRTAAAILAGRSTLRVRVTERVDTKRYRRPQ